MNDSTVLQPDQIFINILVAVPKGRSEISCKIDTGSLVNNFIKTFKNLKLRFLVVLPNDS